MENRAVSDTGPILHLHEINKAQLLGLFSRVIISNIVKEELTKYNIMTLSKNIEIAPINKDQTALISQKYSLELGESSVIWLCKSLNIPLLLTDDLDAREGAESLGIRPVGTIGIILRGYREKIISQEETILLLQNLHQNSSLFITSELISLAISELKTFRKR